MKEAEFLACSGIEMWPRILLAGESFLPEQATAAYIEMTKDERDKLYEASAFVIVGATLQLYALRIEAKGHDTERRISRWSVPLHDVRVSAAAVGDDWASKGFEEVEFEGTLTLPSSIGVFPASIQLPIDETARRSTGPRQRARAFIDAVAIALA